MYRNLIFAKRNFFAFAEIIFWPLVSLLSIGLMGSFLGLGLNFKNFIFTGVITSGVLQITQLDVSYSVLYDIWSKSSKHTFLAPIAHLHYLIGSWIVGMLRGLIVFVLLLFLAYACYGFQAPPVPVLLVFLSGIFLNALVVGTFVCTLILVFGQKVEVTAWSIVALLMLLCGIYYPVNYLPAPLCLLSQYIPLTYFLEYIRVPYGFTTLFSHGLAKGFAGALLYEFVCVYLLKRAFIRSCRNGKIANLSE